MAWYGMCSVCDVAWCEVVSNSIWGLYYIHELQQECVEDGMCHMFFYHRLK